MESIDEERDNGRVAANRRQSLAPCKLAYNGHIHRVEQLLQNTACCKGKRKEKYLGQKRSLQHIHICGGALNHTPLY